LAPVRRVTPPVVCRVTPQVVRRVTPPVVCRVTPPVVRRVTPPVVCRVTPPVVRRVTPQVAHGAVLFLQWCNQTEKCPWLIFAWLH